MIANSDPALEAWAAKINESHGRSVAAIIETGVFLLRAKEDLGHGRWGQIFVPSRLKFGQRRAQLLMNIARNSSLSNPQNFSHLPGCWSVLQVISKLPAEILAKAITSGQVHPLLTLEQALQLVRANRVNSGTRSAKAALQPFDTERRLRRLGDYLRRVQDAWPRDQWPELAGELEGIAGDIRAQARNS